MPCIGDATSYYVTAAVAVCV